jgi:hypothetical protein
VVDALYAAAMAFGDRHGELLRFARELVATGSSG